MYEVVLALNTSKPDSNTLALRYVVIPCLTHYLTMCSLSIDSIKKQKIFEILLFSNTLPNTSVNKGLLEENTTIERWSSQKLVTGLASVPNHTSNKVESPSIVSQRTYATFGNSCNS